MRKKRTVISVMMAITMLLSLAPAAISTQAAVVPAPATFPPHQAAGGTPDPVAVRAAAKAAGLDSLTTVALPPADLTGIAKTGAAADQALLVMGKALFWDEQVGSEGVACATCHFASGAGADPRNKNTINPGPNGVFDRTNTGPGGPNYQLVAGDFPAKTDDVIGSQGVPKFTFIGTVPGQARDNGTAVADPVYNVGGVNVRQVTGRQAPPSVNSAFNVANFWDGRASPIFNGASPLGPMDANAKIWVNNHAAGAAPDPQAIGIANSSLASQAVGPPGSPVEMSFAGRTWPDIGHKLVTATPLALQLVHPNDGVLGPLANATLFGTQVIGNKGLNTTYDALIKAAFLDKYYNGANVTIGAKTFTQEEANFSLFFGLAVQAYERTLISNDSPFDRFMLGNDTALTATQLTGLLAFIGPGNCYDCHAGPEFSNATFTALTKNGGSPFTVEQMLNSSLGLTNPAAYAVLELGFSNIGIRPTAEDIGRGAGTANGFPAWLSWARQKRDGQAFAPFALPTTNANYPNPYRDGVQGAFKVPSLRNIDMMAPYFHNGDKQTLEQTVALYHDLDFTKNNFDNVDPAIGKINIGGGDQTAIVAFLRSLTDDRVRNELAPFDHPQITVANGHLGDNLSVGTAFTTVDGVKIANDNLVTANATGSGGRPANGQPPIGQPPPGVPDPQQFAPGASFAATLNTGWNLLSTPVKLDGQRNRLDVVFDAANLANVDILYGWSNGAWVQLDGSYVLDPLTAIYAKVATGATVQGVFVPSLGLSALPSRTLAAGLNLVGPAPAYQSGAFPVSPLNSALVSAAQAPGGANGYIMVVSPGHNQTAWAFGLGGVVQSMDPFKGYWVVMQNAGTLTGYSYTPIVP